MTSKKYVGTMKFCSTSFSREFVLTVERTWFPFFFNYIAVEFRSSLETLLKILLNTGLILAEVLNSFLQFLVSLLK